MACSLHVLLVTFQEVGNFLFVGSQFFKWFSAIADILIECGSCSVYFRQPLCLPLVLLERR